MFQLLFWFRLRSSILPVASSVRNVIVSWWSAVRCSQRSPTGRPDHRSAFWWWGRRCLIETDPEPHLLGQHLATFGDRGNQLVAGQTGVNHQFPPTITDVSPFQMNGRAVYRFATHAVPISIQTALTECWLTADQVDRFILHQANIRIIQQVARRLVQPMTKFPTNIDQYGNTSAASEPILLDECVRQGLIRRGGLGSP